MTKKTSGTPSASWALRALLLGGVAFGGIGGALAQTDATATAAAATEEEEIVVTGRRPLAESAAAALIVQRNSDSVVSVLSADAIGRLPDQNIAFAVGRLPGISIERDQGQARYINLRGTPVYWNTLSFDGLSVVSPEGRATRLDNIPSAIASQVIVTKAITANMPGDTVAGNVNVITRRASDYEGFSAFGNLALGQVALGGGEEFDSSLVVSNTFLDGRLGVLLQGSFYTRNMVTDNWETDPYVARTAADVASGERFAREYENKPYRLTRQNQSLSFRTDYEFNDNHQVFFSSIFTEYADEELRNNYIFRFDQGRGTSSTAAVNGVRGTGGVAGNTQDRGIVYGVELRPNTNSLESEESTFINTFGGESVLGAWNLDWRLNYTYSADGRDAPGLPDFRSPSTLTDRPTVEYDFTRGDDNTVRLFRTVLTGTTLSRGAAVDSIDAFQWPLRTLSRREGEDLTQAWTFKLDAGTEFEILDRNVEFQTGLMWVDRHKKSRELFFTTGTLTGANLARFTAAGYNPATFYDLIRNGKPYQGDYRLGYNFTYHSKSALDRITADLVARGVLLRDTAVEMNNYYDVNEQVMALYGMSTVDFDWGNIVFGLRAERIENTSTAIPLIGGVRTLTTISGEETLLYPSAHINWDVTDQIKARIGITSTASRPDFDDLRPNFSIDDTNQAISGGNPDAKPEKQFGIDAYLEWYMEPEGFLSAGVFYKDISDVLFTQSTVFGSDALDSGGVDRTGYTFTRVANAGDGNLFGFEVFYQQTANSLVERMGWQPWLGGFGVNVSGTWVDSEVTIPAVLARTGQVLNPRRTARLLGTSDFTGNFQVTYERYDLSIRLAYQYRTDWGQAYGSYVNVNGVLVPGSASVVGGVVTPNASDSANGDTYWDNDDELDLSVRYQINDTFEVYFDGVNLLDGGGRRFVDNSLFPIEYETFGPRYIAGVRFNF